MESKVKLYNRMMSTLKELTAQFVGEAGTAIQRRVLIMEEFRVSLRIGIYAPFGNEVRTALLFTEGDRHRKEMYYPAVDESAGGLAFFRVTDLENLAPGYAGILEPTSEASRLRDLNALDLIIVPGLAFDLHGGRLGYGRNYYDRCLTGFRGKRVALAYDFQIVSEMPMGLRGQKVDWIVTEKRIIRCQ